MDINIKEIFESDLDPNSTAWWSNDKVDKINYNFGQVSTGGVRGPQGYTGVDGEPGYKGNIGPVGWQGTKGSQGFEGAPGINLWDYAIPTATSGAGYLFAKKHPGSIVQYTPPMIRIGTAVGSQGYSNPGGIYDSVVESNVNLATPTSSTIETNLRLQHTHEAATNYFDWKLLGISPDTLRAGRSSNAVAGLTIKHIAGTIENVAGSKIHTATDGLSFTNLVGDINTTTVIVSSGTLNYLPLSSYSNPTGMVLTSLDPTGKTAWTPIRTIIPSYPIGSIISIRAIDFDNPGHFYQNETIAQDRSIVPLPLLANRYGRGKIGTMFEGWYLCNGKEWIDERMIPQYTSLIQGVLTPNLNGFDYQIESNGGQQGLVTTLGNNNILVGGYKIDFEANQPSSPGRYEAGYTNTWHDNDSTTNSLHLISGVHPPAGPDLYVTGEIHIVYLQENNLAWVDDR